MSNRSEESDGTAVSRDQGDSQGKDEGAGGGSFVGVGAVLKKGPWTSAEDAVLIEYVKKHGEGNWNAVQKHSGLSRCGKSCRLRWANHLRPNLKKGAFTAEEEQKIIDLHCKMGNKWAKMATFLPGRTDNEIKNYWNTRIKRRQRAGLPLYPPEMANRDLNESQPDQATSGFDGGDKWQNKLLQPNNHIPEIMFRGYKPDQAVIPFPPNLPEISVSNFISQGLGSCDYSCLIPGNFPKRLRESEALLPRYASSACALPPLLQYPNENSETAQLRGFNFPYDPDPGSKNLPPLAGTLPFSHALPHGNFSASSLVGNMKSELPSLQYPALDPCSWLVSPSVPPLAETNIGSPITTESIQSECVSPRYSGLLDALVHESNVLSYPKNQLPEKSSSSSIAAVSGVVDGTALDLCDADWDICDTMSPLGCSATSVFSECTPPNSGCSLEEIPQNMAAIHVKLEDEEPLQISVKETISPPDLSRPDALLAFSWCSNGATDCSFGDPMASFLGEYSSDCKPLKSVASSPSSEEQALGSYSWNNVPPVCQVPEFP